MPYRAGAGGGEEGTPHYGRGHLTFLIATFISDKPIVLHIYHVRPVEAPQSAFKRRQYRNTLPAGQKPRQRPQERLQRAFLLSPLYTIHRKVVTNHIIMALYHGKVNLSTVHCRESDEPRHEPNETRRNARLLTGIVSKGRSAKDQLQTEDFRVGNEHKKRA